MCCRDLSETTRESVLFQNNCKRETSAWGSLQIYSEVTRGTVIVRFIREDERWWENVGSLRPATLQVDHIEKLDLL